MPSKYCGKLPRCKNSWWCATDFRPSKNVKCFDAMTNADRIRGMSDEELMLFLRDESVFCAHRDESTGGACVVCTGECGDCLTDWLKSPVEGEA